MTLSRLRAVATEGKAYVEGSKVPAVCVEGVVIEFNELSYCFKVSIPGIL